MIDDRYPLKYFQRWKIIDVPHSRIDLIISICFFFFFFFSPRWSSNAICQRKGGKTKKTERERESSRRDKELNPKRTKLKFPRSSKQLQAMKNKAYVSFHPRTEIVVIM